jgi:hypothetical protein
MIDFLIETMKRDRQVSREYGALVDALVEAEQEIDPGLSWEAAFAAARARYQRILKETPEGAGEETT